MDAAGHGSFWGSDLYYEMAKEKDKQVAGILNALALTKTSSGKCLNFFFVLLSKLLPCVYQSLSIITS